MQDQPVDLAELDGFHNGNILFLPDQDVVHPLPWAGVEDYKVGEVFCEPYWLRENMYKVPLPSSRGAAKKQLQRLQEEGYRFMSAFEMEFFLENKLTGTAVYVITIML